MKAHNYHPETFEYVGSEEAHENPLDPEQSHLLPANATFVAPPRFDPKFHTCTWDGARWVAKRKVTVSVAGVDVSVKTWADVHRAAMMAHEASDYVLMRFYEDMRPCPLAWRAYRRALREIINSVDGDVNAPFPQQPALEQ